MQAATNGEGEGDAAFEVINNLAKHVGVLMMERLINSILRYEYNGFNLWNCGKACLFLPPVS
jgi:hypothetical protein